MPEATKAAIYDMISARGGDRLADGIVKRALRAIRSHLGMEVAYVSEFIGDRAVFREVDAPGLEAAIKTGDSHSLDDIFCRHILAGRLPELIPDTAAEPLAMSLPIMKAVPIGRHMSVPIRLPNGEPYGMFCCLGFAPDRSLHERDLKMMRVFADLAAYEINHERAVAQEAQQKQERIRNAIDGKALSIVYQPICDIETRRPVGVESLARFSGPPARPPDKWFNEAAEAGLATMLETTAISNALSALPLFPPQVYLSVNASPETVLSGAFAQAVNGLQAERIVLEITEHARVSDYAALLGALEPMRARGLRLAIDDAGAGYSSLQHILQLRPDIIKLDMALTRSIDLDPARRALALALIGFAHQLNSSIVAEGVETASELKMLSALGIEVAQGFYLARPMSREDAISMCDHRVPAAHVA